MHGRRNAHVKFYSYPPNNVVYSAKPIPVGCLFQVKIQEKTDILNVLSDSMVSKLYMNNAADFPSSEYRPNNLLKD